MDDDSLWTSRPDDDPLSGTQAGGTGPLFQPGPYVGGAEDGTGEGHTLDTTSADQYQYMAHGSHDASGDSSGTTIRINGFDRTTLHAESNTDGRSIIDLSSGTSYRTSHQNETGPGGTSSGPGPK